MHTDGDKELKFQTYMGNNIAYDMLCEPTYLDNRDKQGDNISVGYLMNLKILTTNKDIFLSSYNMYGRRFYR